MFLHLSVILFTGGFSVQGGLCPGVSLFRGVSVWGGSLSRGSLSRRVSVRGVSVQGVSFQAISVMETAPYGNVRAVCILLEFILVWP